MPHLRMGHSFTTIVPFAARHVALLVALVLLGVGASPVRAQTVSLVTFGPGAETFERFGHTALWVHDDAGGIDALYNWGLFDFKDEADLLAQFVRGRLRYWMEPTNGTLTLEWYQRAGRAVWVQDLNVTRDQTERLVSFLTWNARPENKFYSYDYYRDNCTTRVRDAIDLATDKAVARALVGVRTRATYRDHTRRAVAGDLVLYTALETVLARWVDQPIDVWQESFLPFELQRHIRSVMVTDATGNRVPLVRSEVELAGGKFTMPLDHPPRYWPMYALAGIAWGAIIFALSLWARRSRLGWVAMMVPIVLWSVVAGIGGAVMWFAWAFTDHVVSYGNENLLQTNIFLLAFPLLAGAGFLGWRRGLRAARRVAVIIAALSVIGLLLKVLPPFHQVNAEIIAMSLPINLAMAWVMIRLAPDPPGAGEPRRHEGTKNATKAVA